jgi:diguanylate cyclase (GGDEF)-like protein
LKILVADDEGATRLRLEALLTKLGHEVVVARDGSEAWEILQREDAPSLAILDWIMPGVDGVELCRRLRQGGRKHYIYVIMVTVKSSRQDLLTGMEAGADDYLTKPFDLEELRVRVGAGERIVARQSDLETQATRDDLTGLLNRGTILEVVKREFARVARLGTTAGIILADLDNFKHINDTYGHPVGDEVLREAALRLSANMRAYDAIGRYGGEEFLMLVPGCDLFSLMDTAEHARATVSGGPIRTRAGPIQLTVSLGIEVIRKSTALDLNTSIRAADDALYRAKRGGRNRVEGPLTTPCAI